MYTNILSTNPTPTKSWALRIQRWEVTALVYLTTWIFPQPFHCLTAPMDHLLHPTISAITGLLLSARLWTNVCLQLKKLQWFMSQNHFFTGLYMFIWGGDIVAIPLKEGMATYSSILAWRIPWTEEPGGLWSIGSQRVGHNWINIARTHIVAMISKPLSFRNNVEIKQWCKRAPIK